VALANIRPSSAGGREKSTFSPNSDAAELNDELPDDIEDDEKYIAIPDKRELGLGKPLALEFAREFLPGDFDDVRHIFDRKGA
jgi:hypothetical protein